jgi:hypothetical protein
MTLAVAHAEGNVAVLDAIREVRPPFSPEAVTVDFASVLKTYGVSRVCGDWYGGEWPRERFSVHGVTYELSEKPKKDIYQALLPLLNSGKARLLDSDRLVGQLCSLERRTARGGRDSIDHPPGGHDDLANAVAGALTAVTGPSAVVSEWLRAWGDAEPIATPRRTMPRDVAEFYFPTI